MLPLHPDHMLRMFHAEQKELLFAHSPGRRFTESGTRKLNGARTMRKVVLVGRRIYSGTAPARHLAGPECCTP